MFFLLQINFEIEDRSFNRIMVRATAVLCIMFKNDADAASHYLSSQGLQHEHPPPTSQYAVPYQNDPHFLCHSSGLQSPQPHPAFVHRPGAGYQPTPIPTLHRDASETQFQRSITPDTFSSPSHSVLQSYPR